MQKRITKETKLLRKTLKNIQLVKKIRLKKNEIKIKYFL